MILVFLELENDKIKEASLKVLEKGREIAGSLGAYVKAVKAAPIDGEKLFNSLSALIEREKPEILLFADTPIAEELAPRIAQHFRTCLIEGCTELDMDLSNMALLMRKPICKGLVMVEYSCSNFRPQIATLNAASFYAPSSDELLEGEEIK